MSDAVLDVFVLWMINTKLEVEADSLPEELAAWYRKRVRRYLQRFDVELPTNEMNQAEWIEHFSSTKVLCRVAAMLSSEVVPTNLITKAEHKGKLVPPSSDVLPGQGQTRKDGSHRS